jgi:hypothetical protein
MHALISRWRNAMRSLATPTEKQTVWPKIMAFPVFLS